MSAPEGSTPPSPDRADAPAKRKSRAGKRTTAGTGPTRPPKVDELDPEQRNDLYESAKKADYDIPKLQAMSISALLDLAEDEGIQVVPGLSKQELIYELLRSRVTRTGLGWGEGVLDILPDGFGFLRSPHYDYEPGPDDIYVSPSQVRRLNLKQGHQLAGPVRPPKKGEKYFALLHVEVVNGGTVTDLRSRIPFDELTPTLPTERLRLEHEGCAHDVRMLDLLAPMGKGQRTLILSPPQAGRTLLLTRIARALLHEHPELFVVLCLVDDRPEDVTEVERSTGPEGRREVVASTFDEPTTRHVALAEMALARAQRLVEAGRDVVLLFDSLTQLARAYNQEVPHSGKILVAGLDSVALHKPKKLFGAARRLEEGGSLTVVATVLTDTGSRIDEAIAEEFTGKANCEIVLDRELAWQHVYPSLDTARTGTRREDNLLEADELDKVRRLRKQLTGLGTQKAIERLQKMLAKSKDNAELLAGL